MVNVGVIGLGPRWEAGYRDALERLRSRIAVRAVYTAVESRAAQAAAAWHADVAHGMRALMERPDVRAVLLLDTAWHGGRPLEYVLASGKPAFVAAWPELHRPAIEQLARRARDESLTLIPAFPQRYVPATARLRELIATRIGRPLRLRIETACPPDALPTASGGPGGPGGPGCEPLVHLFDWCRQVVRTAPATVQASPASAEAPGGRIEIEFRAPRGGAACRAELELRSLDANDTAGTSGTGWTSGTGGPAANGPPLRIEVAAERGEAILEGASAIRWTSGGHSAEESLTGERDEREVMLDLFCRRVVGGLIPVADFGDIARGLALWSACAQSLRTGSVVNVDA